MFPNKKYNINWELQGSVNKKELNSNIYIKTKSKNINYDHLANLRLCYMKYFIFCKENINLLKQKKRY